MKTILCIVVTVLMVCGGCAGCANTKVEAQTPPSNTSGDAVFTANGYIRDSGITSLEMNDAGFIREK